MVISPIQISLRDDGNRVLVIVHDPGGLISIERESEALGDVTKLYSFPSEEKEWLVSTWLPAAIRTSARRSLERACEATDNICIDALILGAGTYLSVKRGFEIQLPDGSVIKSTPEMFDPERQEYFEKNEFFESLQRLSRNFTAALLSQRRQYNERLERVRSEIHTDDFRTGLELGANGWRLEDGKMIKVFDPPLHPTELVFDHPDLGSVRTELPARFRQAFYIKEIRISSSGSYVRTYGIGFHPHLDYIDPYERSGDVETWVDAVHRLEDPLDVEVVEEPADLCVGTLSDSPFIEVVRNVESVLQTINANSMYLDNPGSSAISDYIDLIEDGKVEVDLHPLEEEVIIV